MNNYIYLLLYVVFAVSGSTLLKFGSAESIKNFIIIPIININISIYTLLGFFAYGCSFILYTILLNKFELSFISPLTTGIVYMILMFTAFIFFKEPLTLGKAIGSSLILIGVLTMIISK